MAITFVGPFLIPGHFYSGSTPTDLVVSYPTGATDGDLAIVEISASIHGTSQPGTIATPTGWTALQTGYKGGTPSVRYAPFYKFLDSSDTGGWTFVGSVALDEIGQIWAFRGVDPTTPIPESGWLAQASSGTTRATPSITTAGERFIIYSTHDRNASNPTPPSPDTKELNTLMASSVSLTTAIIGDSVAGTYQRTFTGAASTSIAGSAIYALMPAASTGFAATATFGGEGTVAASGAASGASSASLAGTGSMTATAASTAPGAATLSGVGSLTVTTKSALAAHATLTGTGSLSAATNAHFATAATLSGSGVLAVNAPTPLQLWLAARPLNVVHHGGDADWVVHTLNAYEHAAAWNSTACLEVSIWQSSDGVWVASEGNTTGAVFGTNLTITSSTWASLSTLRTTVGNYPMMRLTDLLDEFGSTRILMVDNKQGVNQTALFDLLDSYAGASRYMMKGAASEASKASAAHARGYTTWGFYYDSDMSSIGTTQASWDLLGQDVLSTTNRTADWATALSYGKPVLAHIVATAAQKATAVGLGANGFMASGVMEVIPQTPQGASLAGTGTLSASASTPHASTAALNGAGSLAVSSSARIIRTVALSGTGTLTVARTARMTAVATLSGAGSLTASSGASKSASASLASIGILSATANASFAVSRMFSGTGTLSSSAIAYAGAGAQFAGSGTLYTSGVAHADGTATLDGAGVLTVTSNAHIGRVATLNGVGKLTAVGGTNFATVAPFIGSLGARQWSSGLTPELWTAALGSRTWKGALV